MPTPGNLCLGIAIIFVFLGTHVHSAGSSDTLDYEELVGSNDNATTDTASVSTSTERDVTDEIDNSDLSTTTESDEESTTDSTTIESSTTDVTDTAEGNTDEPEVTQPTEATTQGSKYKAPDGSTDFPQPNERLTVMIEAAKDFIHKYLSKEKWKALKQLVRTVKAIGGTRRDTHRTVNVFLARVLTPAQKREIAARKEELFRIFGDNLAHLI